MKGGVTLGGVLDARRVAARPVRVGVGEVVRVRQRIDRSRPPTGQRAQTASSMPTSPTGRIGHSRARVGLGRPHRIVKGFDEVRSEAPGNGQRRRRHPGHQR